MAATPIKTGKTTEPKNARVARSYSGTYGNPNFYPGSHSDQRRLGYNSLDRDIATLLSEYRQRMLIADGRYIFQAFPLVSGAVRQKSDYVYGSSWQLQSDSKDSKFARAVEEDFTKIDAALDIRGPAYSFRRNIWRLSKSLDVDGDAFILLTESPDTGFPQIQYLEAHRIGSFKNENKTIVQAGRYRGRRIISGIILNDYSAPLAYRVLDETSTAGYRDYPASAIIHIIDMEWFSQARGQPTIAAGIIDWYDLAETKDAQKIKQKVNSSLTLVESNETGNIDTGLQTVNPRPSAGQNLQTKLYDSGLIRYIKNGGKLTAHTANDPSEGWLKFTHSVQADALYGMRWRREMFDAQALARAGARGLVNDINTAIRSRCEVLCGYQRRAALYIIAKRAKMGAYTLPPDWFKISFTKPAEFTTDEGRLRAADLNDLRAGVTTESIIVGRSGLDYEAFLERSAKDVATKKRIAEQHGLHPSELGILTLPGDPNPDDTSNDE